MRLIGCDGMFGDSRDVDDVGVSVIFINTNVASNLLFHASL